MPISDTLNVFKKEGERIMRDTNAAAQDDTPATALGPTALVLGAFSTIGVFAFFPFAWIVFFPLAWIAGPLAVTFGVAGIHYARQGVGRMWTATLGTALGAAGMIGMVSLFGGLAA